MANGVVDVAYLDQVRWVYDRCRDVQVEVLVGSSQWYQFLNVYYEETIIGTEVPQFGEQTECYLVVLNETSV